MGDGGISEPGSGGQKSSDPTYLHISKIDAARRQLEVAIQLFLTSSDPVATHTLASAAHELLRVLGKPHGMGSMLEAIGRIRPRLVAELRRYLKEPANFFKHANSDPDKVLLFLPEMIGLLLSASCLLYTRLTKEETPLMRVFMGWFSANYYPEFQPPQTKELANRLQAQGGTSRRAWLQVLPEVVLDMARGPEKT